jgi:hypothetical protein
MAVLLSNCGRFAASILEAVRATPMADGGGGRLTTGVKTWRYAEARLKSAREVEGL